MKPTFQRVLASIHFTCFILLIFLIAGSPTLAQNTESRFKVGDRVEADIDFIENPGNEDWRRGTIIKVFEALSGNGNPQKDSVIVSLADTVDTQGSDATIEARWLAELNIPYGKTDPVKVKLISRTAKIKDSRIKKESNRERTNLIYTIVTDKRYVLYMRRLVEGRLTAAVAVDESGAIVGGRVFSTVFTALEHSNSEDIASHNRFYWADQLISDKIAAAGNLQGKMPGYLVKTDDGKTYLLGAKNLRPLTQ